MNFTQFAIQIIKLGAIQHKKNPKEHVELNNNSILKFLSYSQKRKKMKINL